MSVDQVIGFQSTSFEMRELDTLLSSIFDKAFSTEL
jgi:hypothetical protein